ncbi:hypothetical protein NUSPORA_00367 [Nucleospora cyclopteri]
MSYDNNVNVYSSDGRIKQVEYAMKAMNLGSTTIAIKLEDCIILASEKKLANSLQKPDSIKKHFKIFDNIVTAFAGVTADAPTIIKKCRQMCTNHMFVYDTTIPSQMLMNNICSLALKFSEDDYSKMIYSRPFGASFVVAVYEEEPKLFFIDPSGSYMEYRAKAIGSASEMVENQLEKEIDTFKEESSSVIKVLEMLKSVMKDKITVHNVELSILRKEGLQKFDTEALNPLLEAIK